MISLIAACLFFLLIHFGVSGTRLRDVLTGRLGEGPYRALFSLASAVGLVWMGMSFGAAPFVLLWGSTPELLPVAKGLVFVAFLCIGVGLATRNPTSVGAESRLSGEGAVQGILRITRHPFLWGTALWALVHIVMNGELRAVIMFGSLLLLAIGGTLSIDAKRRRHFGADWGRFASATSNAPFVAIATGRNRLGPALREIGFVRPGVAVLVYLAVTMFHGRLFGKPLM